jgi:hypothetical protein
MPKVPRWPQSIRRDLGVGQGVDIGPAEPADPTGRDGAGGLRGQDLVARAVICTESWRAAIPGIVVMSCA